jgi:hypothetical protein
LKSIVIQIYFDHSVGVKKRLPIKPEDIKKVQAECYKADDEKRWLIALIADTLMRLAEGAGLLRSDFIEQDGILCVNIRPHPWRSLKQRSYSRNYGLVCNLGKQMAVLSDMLDNAWRHFFTAMGA